jgi:lipoprotein-anchoring transpeptidase ErfK/SrfK
MVDLTVRQFVDSWRTALKWVRSPVVGVRRLALASDVGILVIVPFSPLIRKALQTVAFAGVLMLAPAANAAAAADVLSNENTLSRWATPNSQAPVRVAPRGDAKSFVRLRYQTEDRQPEIYLALRQTVDDAGDEWVQVRLPRRPNGSTGWVRRDALGPFQTVTTKLVVDRRRLRATLYRNGRRIWSSPIGVGARGTPTPGGRFYIREKLHALGGGTIYGPLAFGTSAYSSLSEWPRGGVIGIHGTNQPELIPGRPSHGCIRVPNRNILKLARLLPLGTPLQIK